MFKGVEQREGQDGVVPLLSEQEIPLFAAGHVTARDEMEW